MQRRECRAEAPTGSERFVSPDLVSVQPEGELVKASAATRYVGNQSRQKALAGKPKRHTQRSLLLAYRS